MRRQSSSGSAQLIVVEHARGDAAHQRGAGVRRHERAQIDIDGLALAQFCAGRGMAVAMLDIDGPRVQEAAHGVRVVARRLDVSSWQELQDVA